MRSYTTWAGHDSVAASIKGVTHDPEVAATRTADALNALGWQKAVPYLDLIKFDKYERDETSDGVLAGHAYDFHE